MRMGLKSGYHAAVVGATGGLGAAFTHALAADPDCAMVHALSRGGAGPEGARIRTGTIDIEAPETIAAAAEAVGRAAAGRLALVIVATGFLHDETQGPEKRWRELEADALARAFRVNATGPALVARAVLPLMPRERAVFAALSARVGSVSDNRAGGWYGYRASKAALNQILKCLAIEAARTRPDWVILGLQPGTVRTPLSAPFRASVPPGGLFAPEEAAGHLLRVISEAGPDRSGQMVDWQGNIVPP